MERIIMGYFVLCTFDLKGASREDYTTAYSDLKVIGLKRVMVASNGKDVVIPTTTVAGKFNGNSAGEVRTYICDKVQKAFSDRGFSSEIFVVVGGDWAWGGRTT